MVKVSDIGALIFFSVIGAVLICIGALLFGIVGMYLFAIPPLLFGAACLVVAVSVGRHTFGRPGR